MRWNYWNKRRFYVEPVCRLVRASNLFLKGPEGMFMTIVPLAPVQKKDMSDAWNANEMFINV